jgi:hypothetical protein
MREPDGTRGHWRNVGAARLHQRSENGFQRSTLADREVRARELRGTVAAGSSSEPSMSNPGSDPAHVADESKVSVPGGPIQSDIRNAFIAAGSRPGLRPPPQ